MAVLCQRLWEQAEVLPSPQPPRAEPVPHHTPLQQHQNSSFEGCLCYFYYGFQL